MTADDLVDLMVRDLARSSGGGLARWRKAVGRLKVYPRSTHAHCNWEARPTGTASEVALIERCADGFRQRAPFVQGD